MKIIAGNWKMNKSVAQTADFIEELKPFTEDKNSTVILCVPFTGLGTAVNCAKRSKIKIGAQNVHWEESGAFTGEISCSMLTETGAEYVIVGHSERRQFFGETDETVCKRAVAALTHGLNPIICIGETLEQREFGDAKRVLDAQIRLGFAHITKEMLGKVTVAYEPVWAIGTGKTATSGDANNTIEYIRRVLADVYGARAARGLKILYGGSVNENNARELFNTEQIDGALVGGASLTVDKFVKIIEYAE